MSSNAPAYIPETALIVGGGPGISSSCARLFHAQGMNVAVAARTPDKPELQGVKALGAHLYACDASEPPSVERLFQGVTRDLGAPRLVVHNIDGRVPGILRKPITEADPALAFATMKNAAFSAFLVGQHAARLMLENAPDTNGVRGTIVFTNASVALKGFVLSGAFAMACHAKAGLAQSMARELMPKGIHVANVPIDAAIGFTSPMARARIASRARRWTTTWPTRIASLSVTFNCTASIARPGPLKLCYVRGSRSGDGISELRTIRRSISMFVG